MTILKKMTTLTINKKHLSVNEQHFSDSGERSGHRARSERASSLALPHSSLLDFYDKQQEQCNSVALLPSSVNMVVRRHSSHYYPMLEDKQQQQQQPPPTQLPSVLSRSAAQSTLGGTVAAAAGAGVVIVPSASPPTHTVMAHFDYNIKAQRLLMQDMQDMQSTTAGALTPLASGVNNTREQQHHQGRGAAGAGAGGATTSVSVTAATPDTPPPPIPKRTFRGKYAWNAGTPAAGSPTSAAQTPTKHDAIGAVAGITAFVYPQSQQAQQDGSSHYYSNTVGEGGSGTLFVDIAARQPSYADSGLDAGGISDDDRMSLENSVFDESLTSTPVKVSTIGAGGGGGGGKPSPYATAKTLGALSGNAELSSAAKRSNRSSSSTVDSAITTSMSSSSGYGSHRERFASNSTTADFRSRFSSVDTQSSLDSSCIAAEKVCDSPSLTKDYYKMDRSVLNDVLLHDFNRMNNNEFNTNLDGGDGALMAANNNNSLGRQASSDSPAAKLPAVPMRKQHVAPAKTHSYSGGGGIGGTAKSAVATVSASTSTSSTGSTGSGSLSSGSAMSISANGSNSAISPLSYNGGGQQQKRSIPPAPPTRNQISFDSGQQQLQQLAAPAEGGGKAALPLTIRNKLNKHKPPPIVYPKLHQRQDSNLSSDSFSATSSPGYNSKNLMDAPLLPNAARINKSGPGMAMRHQDSSDSFGMTASRYVFSGLGNPMAPPTARHKLNYRQDSTISSDSFSQTSSPGYNTKVMEAPLLPSLSVKRLCGVPAPIVCKQKLQNETIEELEQSVPMSPLTKCVSTPASLQTIVRFQNGAPNTMSLQHTIINRRKSSNPYITNGRLKFRLFQVLLNAFALLAIAGGLAAYFHAYPTIKFVNKTIINTIHVEDVSSFGKNPAPGTCLPIIVKFCQTAQIPYNYTVFPNYIGHFGQLETQVDLDPYEALVDVRCYELVSLFLCTLFVPKCGTTGATVPPCKTLCTETMRRCGFFFDVFGLSLPEYLNCKLFKDFESAEDCVGLDQVRDVMIASTNPKCEGFQCDQNRCIPKDYVCDGHLDCMDQADEANCERCEKDEIYCGDDHCISSKHICDGIVDCPYGQDERNCIRLSERNGDLGKGVLEVFRIKTHQWTAACVKNWDRAVSPTAVCSMLGYSSVNATSVVTQKTHRPLLTSVNISTDIWKMYAKKRSNLMQQFSNCTPDEDYPIAELTCANYECGKVKRGRHKPSRRIIGGSHANPGSWPFLAAILGGPEKIFYCAGVLISDQWVLTASHCIGNHTVIDLEDWTIQLGVTRRNSFTYSGQKVKVKTVIPHPLYNTAIAHDNDIALFQLASRVAFHEHLLPVCLPPPGIKQLKPEQLCTVIGWGKREDKDPKSTYEPIVNEVQVPIIRRQQCDEWLDNLTVSEGMICAGYEEGGKDACQGDSGGPLLCPYPGEKDRWFVGGIVSWGIMCAHPKLPGVYANVFKYVPWIQEQIQKHSKPVNDDKLSKYDAHPGGPDILSNMATGPVRSKKPYNNQNRSPMDIDYYGSYEKT